MELLGAEIVQIVRTWPPLPDGKQIQVDEGWNHRQETIKIVRLQNLDMELHLL